mmetsp:Transcript_2831/g.11559  ORF Transcript_2831/g.11559 Transcript_2831/m.11559 type:complete len:237 (-) Transcript_2831:78-788(-)|eukprot:scaffold1307_cov200-Pinguiococcus_pyrenoidosus.AAC.126
MAEPLPLRTDRGDGTYGLLRLYGAALLRRLQRSSQPPSGNPQLRGSLPAQSVAPFSPRPRLFGIKSGGACLVLIPEAEVVFQRLDQRAELLHIQRAVHQAGGEVLQGPAKLADLDAHLLMLAAKLEVLVEQRFAVAVALLLHDLERGDPVGHGRLAVVRAAQHPLQLRSHRLLLHAADAVNLLLMRVLALQLLSQEVLLQGADRLLMVPLQSGLHGPLLAEQLSADAQVSQLRLTS